MERKASDFTARTPNTRKNTGVVKPGNEATGGTICRFYKTPRGCWNGDQCRFVHDDGLAVPSAMPRCRFYGTPEGCRYGDSCYFLHDEPQVSAVEQQKVCENIDRLCIDEGPDSLTEHLAAGQQQCVAIDNSGCFFNKQDLEYYTVPRGQEMEPKLPQLVLPALLELLNMSNMHPVKISLNLKEHPELMNESYKVCKVLDLLCEKAMKARNTDHVKAMKVHYFATVIRKAKDDSCLDDWIKKLLMGRASDGYPEFQEQLLRQALQEFPYVTSPLFRGLVRMLSTTEIGDHPTSLELLNEVLNGERFGFDIGKDCSACGDPSAVKKCSACKMVHYCSQECQKLHWFTHKKFCKDLAEGEEDESVSDNCSDLLNSEEEAEKRFDNWKKEIKKLEKTRPDIDVAKCSSCASKFEGDDAFDGLMDHYYEQMQKSNFKHKVFIKTPLRRNSTMCLLCDRYFAHCGSLLQHLLAKSRRKDKDGNNHMLLVTKGILEPTCFRDTVHHDNDILNEELSVTLIQDTHEEDLAELFGYTMMARGFGGFGSDDDDSDGDYFNSDCYELLCQGIKPWDPEAGAALAVLNGW
ncbi:uncharacterized protein LOC123561321 isoform X2 [Mercenaria mercenaria]|uniref:uncharacterized protein LOC123561321 isoform X2 n=1 Tax=Mercenaria mercenaria TaxID=6596 RepID=UPI00234FB188|nr:uncharacterized protein LOC123561321 isoform X2 [Mercenaria mercenaria]